MAPLPRPLAFFLLLFSGWINRHQQAVIAYLLEENRVGLELLILAPDPAFRNVAQR